MKYINLTAIVFLGVAAFAQDVQFDYNRSANFNTYKTYQWVDYKPVQVGDELLDQDIKRAVDEQLAGKGLRRVESGGDLLVGYQAGISQEKQFDSFGSRGWGGPFGWGLGNWGDTRVTSSTIDIGKLVIGLFDPAIKQLIWRGSASKTLDIKKDPEKNYRTLEKAMAKLFKNYPQAWAKGNRLSAKSDLPDHSAARLGGAEDEAMRQVALEQAAARYRAGAPDNASWL